MSKRTSHGFSLLELSVAIAVSALIGLLVWKFLAVSTPVANGNRAELSLLQAQDAIEGFAQANYRLPCPASSVGGSEDCDSGASSGWLPARTLGLSGIDPIKYGAASGLMSASNRYAPDLPPIVANSDATRDSSGYTSPLTNTENGYTSPTNGLDLCYGILKLTSGIASGGVSSAYVLADAGNNHTFDGADATGFALPGTPQTSTFDDQLIAGGRGELFTRLGCPARLDAVDGAARSAYAAYDMARLSILYHTFRIFDVKVRQYDYDMAELSYVLAVVNEVISVGTAAVDAADVAIDISGTNIATVGTLISDLGSLYSATSSLAQAEEGISDAESALETAETQRDNAVTYQSWALNQATILLENAEALDQKGLLQ